MERTRAVGLIVLFIDATSTAAVAQHHIRYKIMTGEWVRIGKGTIEAYVILS
jgi:hypothetical protein